MTLRNRESDINERSSSSKSFTSEESRADPISQDSFYLSDIISKLKRKFSLNLFKFPVRHLLSSLSQLVTLPFQSQVCLSKSKASPLGHVICFSPDLVHLRGRQPTAKMFIFERNNTFSLNFYRKHFCFFCCIVLSKIKKSLLVVSRLLLLMGEFFL